MKTICYAVCISLLLISDVWADGVRVLGTISQREVIRRSQVILVVHVHKVQHRYAMRRAYRKNHRYIRHYRALVHIQSVLRGKDQLHSRLKRSRRLWLSMGGTAIPGKWVGIRDHYQSTYHFHSVKPNDRFVAYIERADFLQFEGQAHKTHFRYADPIQAVPKLKKAIPLVIEKEQRAWRKGSICQGLNTWQFRKRCRTIRFIKRHIRCPRRTKPFLEWDERAPYIYCRSAKKRADGPYLHWYRSGRLQRKTWFWNGKYHKQMTVWHKNGKVSVKGYTRRGKRKGLWLFFDAKGQQTSAVCYLRGKPIWKTKGKKRKVCRVR